jgi:hypothetical protein
MGFLPREESRMGESVNVKKKAKKYVKESFEPKLTFREMMKLVVESGGQQQIDPVDQELFAWASRVAKQKLGEGMKAEVYAGMVYERMGGAFNMYDVLSESSTQEEIFEANFSPEDIASLNKIDDLEQVKSQAFDLISKPSKRPMKPEKVEFFKNRLDSMTNKNAVLKLMYDLMLSGEGQAVLGSRNSMSSNSYRRRFN